MEKMIFDNGIKKIDIFDTDENLITQLKINTADSATIQRFSTLISKLESIADKTNEKIKSANASFGDKKVSELTTDEIVQMSAIRIEYLEEVIAEIDVMFGAGTIRNIFKDAYELNADFVPDEDALLDFIDKIIPIMSGLFGERFKRNRARYNAGRRGNK